MSLKDVLTQLQSEGIIRPVSDEIGSVQVRATPVSPKEDTMENEGTAVVEQPVVQEQIGIEEPAAAPVAAQTPVVAPAAVEAPKVDGRKKRTISPEARERMIAGQQARREAERKDPKKTVKAAKVPGRKRGRPAGTKNATKAAKIASGRKQRGRPRANVNGASANSQYLILYPKGRGMGYKLFDGKADAEEFLGGLKSATAFREVKVVTSGVTFSE